MTAIQSWFTQPHVGRMLKLSVPVMVAMLLQSLFGTVDLIFIARLGTVEAAAASMSFSFVWMLIGLTGMVTAGTLAYVSRNIGRSDIGMVRRTLKQTDALSLLLSVTLMALLMPTMEGAFRLVFNASEDVTQAAMQYLPLVLLGFPAVFLAANHRTALQSMGETVKPLIYLGIGNILNIILDPLFIYGFDMGIAGAALATLISNVLSAVLLGHDILRRCYEGKLSVYFKSAWMPKKDIAEILTLGFWDTLQAIARPITGLIMFRIVFEAGREVGAAAFGIGGQLFNYTFIVLGGLSVGVSVLVGQQLGATGGKLDKSMIRDGLILAGLNMAIFALPFTVLSRYLLLLFTADEALIEASQVYLTWIYPGLIFVIFPIILGGVLRGSGNTRLPMMASLISNVAFKLPAALLLAKWFYDPVRGVWLAIALSVVVEAAIIFYDYRKGDWVNEKI